MRHCKEDKNKTEKEEGRKEKRGGGEERGKKE
jgi:hypothetical protein